MKSAYFPDDSMESPVLSAEYVGSSTKKYEQLHFPLNRDVLWDRSRLHHTLRQIIRPQDALPPLLLPLTSITEILSNCLTNTSFDQRVVVFSTHHFHNDVKYTHVLEQPFKLSPSQSFIMQLQDQEMFKSSISMDKVVSLTVPITFQTKAYANTNDALTFDTDSTSNMLTNLAKSIRLSPEFSLKSLIRMRCIGAVTRTSQPLSVALRFEAFLPAVTFAITPMELLPIQPTTLFAQLVNSKDSASTGYLTMTQVRRLILLQETDGLVSTVPVVGIWVALPTSQIKHPATSLLSHPVVWAACTRFLFTEKVRERVYSQSKVFLLVVIAGSEVSNYEVSPEAANDLSSAKDFAYLDFTLDISQDDHGSMLCTFKPVRRAESLMRVRPITWEPFDHPAASVSERGTPSQWLEPTRNEAIHTTPHILRHSLAELEGSEMRPRSIIPLPASPMQPPTPPKQARADEVYDDLSPAAVIASQRQEIVVLQQQINELKNIVTQLVLTVGGSKAADMMHLVADAVVSAAHQPDLQHTIQQSADDTEALSEERMVATTAVESAPHAYCSHGLHELEASESAVRKSNSVSATMELDSVSANEELEESILVMEPPSAVLLPSFRTSALQPSKSLAHKFPPRRLSIEKKATALDVNTLPTMHSSDDSVLETSYTESESMLAIERKYMGSLR